MAPPSKLPPPSHVVIDKNTTARINVGILITILATAVGGAMYLQDIKYAVTTANTTLTEVKRELARQNGSVIRNAETLIRQGAKIQALEKRLGSLENKK